MPEFSRSDPSANERFKGQHRFEHWYRDNTVYFITARCCDKYPAFASEQAKAIFWDRFDCYTTKHGFNPWVTTILDNHYHAPGYLRVGVELKQLMRKLHGSVAKLVNDVLPVRRVPFWCEDEHNDYFDGCIRDAVQLDRAFRYTRDQAVRAGIVRNWREHAHTRVLIDLPAAMRQAVELGVYFPDVPYQRYVRRGSAT